MATLGNNTHITVAGVTLDSDLNQVKLSFTQGKIDVSVFGTNGWKKFIVGLAEATMDVVGFFNKTAAKIDATIFALLGAPTSSSALEVDLPDSNAGSIRYTGNGFATAYSPDSQVNQPIKVSAQFAIDGAVTRATI